jgi:hypothetical protein
MVERLIFPTFLFLALVGCFVAVALRAPAPPKRVIPGAIFPSFVVAVEADTILG